MRVAFVDDNEAHRVLMETAFPRVDVYSEPCDALLDYDMVLMDYELGIYNGLDEARILAAKNPSQAIFIISAHGHIDCEFKSLPKGDIGVIRETLEPVNHNL
jgi:FixJ family two-component response regulator